MLVRKDLGAFYGELQTPARVEVSTGELQLPERKENENSELTQS